MHVQAAAFGEWFPWMLPSQRMLLYRKLHSAAGCRVRLCWCCCWMPACLAIVCLLGSGRQGCWLQSLSLRLLGDPWAQDARRVARLVHATMLAAQPPLAAPVKHEAASH